MDDKIQIKRVKNKKYKLKRKNNILIKIINKLLIKKLLIKKLLKLLKR